MSQQSILAQSGFFWIGIDPIIERRIWEVTISFAPQDLDSGKSHPGSYRAQGKETAKIWQNLQQNPIQLDTLLCGHYRLFLFCLLRCDELHQVKPGPHAAS